MDQEINLRLAGLVRRIPEWLRHDLTSKDTGTRERAEETLLAMIADVLSNSPNR